MLYRLLRYWIHLCISDQAVSIDHSVLVVNSSGPFTNHGLTFIPAWISDYIHYKVWNEITVHPLKFRNG